MKDTMDKMEQERAEMVAEVEAQIERALASMAVDIDDSDYASSRPQSRMSNASGPSRSRRPSDATSKARHLRSFVTESTLAESYSEDRLIDDHDQVDNDLKPEIETGTIEEEDEEEESHIATKKKRFSASEVDAPQDGMNAVDEGISQKSDKIAQKVLEIQHKVCRSPLTSFHLNLMFLFSLRQLLLQIDEAQNGDHTQQPKKVVKNLSQRLPFALALREVSDRKQSPASPGLEVALHHLHKLFRRKKVPHLLL